MADVHTRLQRSYNMSQIKCRDTSLEIKIKTFLKNRGFVYQPKMYGKPDFADHEKKIVIFLDGCFWHKCPKHFKYPATNINFWKNKLDTNAIRDKEITLNYKNSGWVVIRTWEHYLKSGTFKNWGVFKKL